MAQEIGLSNVSTKPLAGQVGSGLSLMSRLAALLSEGNLRPTPYRHLPFGTTVVRLFTKIGTFGVLAARVITSKLARQLRCQELNFN